SSDKRSFRDVGGLARQVLPVSEGAGADLCASIHRAYAAFGLWSRPFDYAQDRLQAVFCRLKAGLQTL
ncbi:hypothetical protein, partial [Methylomagnum sp.]